MMKSILISVTAHVFSLFKKEWKFKEDWMAEDDMMESLMISIWGKFQLVINERVSSVKLTIKKRHWQIKG